MTCNQPIAVPQIKTEISMIRMFLRTPVSVRTKEDVLPIYLSVSLGSPQKSEAYQENARGVQQES